MSKIKHTCMNKFVNSRKSLEQFLKDSPHCIEGHNEKPIKPTKGGDGGAGGKNTGVGTGHGDPAGGAKANAAAEKAAAAAKAEKARIAARAQAAADAAAKAAADAAAKAAADAAAKAAADAAAKKPKDDTEKCRIGAKPGDPGYKNDCALSVNLVSLEDIQDSQEKSKLLARLGWIPEGFGEGKGDQGGGDLLDPSSLPEYDSCPDQLKENWDQTVATALLMVAGNFALSKTPFNSTVLRDLKANFHNYKGNSNVARAISAVATTAAEVAPMGVGRAAAASARGLGTALDKVPLKPTQALGKWMQEIKPYAETFSKNKELKDAIKVIEKSSGIMSRVVGGGSKISGLTLRGLKNMPRSTIGIGLIALILYRIMQASGVDEDTNTMSWIRTIMMLKYIDNIALLGEVKVAYSEMIENSTKATFACHTIAAVSAFATLGLILNKRPKGIPTKKEIGKQMSAEFNSITSIARQNSNKFIDDQFNAFSQQITKSIPKTSLNTGDSAAVQVTEALDRLKSAFKNVKHGGADGKVLGERLYKTSDEWLAGVTSEVEAVSKSPLLKEYFTKNPNALTKFVERTWVGQEKVVRAVKQQSRKRFEVLVKPKYTGGADELSYWTKRFETTPKGVKGGMKINPALSSVESNLYKNAIQPGLVDDYIQRAVQLPKDARSLLLVDDALGPELLSALKPMGSNAAKAEELLRQLAKSSALGRAVNPNVISKTREKVRKWFEGDRGRPSKNWARKGKEEEITDVLAKAQRELYEAVLLAGGGKANRDIITQLLKGIEGKIKAAHKLATPKQLGVDWSTHAAIAQSISTVTILGFAAYALNRVGEDQHHIFTSRTYPRWMTTFPFSMLPAVEAESYIKIYKYIRIRENAGSLFQAINSNISRRTAVAQEIINNESDTYFKEASKIINAHDTAKGDARFAVRSLIRSATLQTLKRLSTEYKEVLKEYLTKVIENPNSDEINLKGFDTVAADLIVYGSGLKDRIEKYYSKTLYGQMIKNKKAGLAPGGPRWAPMEKTDILRHQGPREAASTEVKFLLEITKLTKKVDLQKIKDLRSQVTLFQDPENEKRIEFTKKLQDPENERRIEFAKNLGNEASKFIIIGDSNASGLVRALGGKKEEHLAYPSQNTSFISKKVQDYFKYDPVMDKPNFLARSLPLGLGKFFDDNEKLPDAAIIHMGYNDPARALPGIKKTIALLKGKGIKDIRVINVKVDGHPTDKSYKGKIEKLASSISALEGVKIIPNKAKNTSEDKYHFTKEGYKELLNSALGGGIPEDTKKSGSPSTKGNSRLNREDFQALAKMLIAETDMRAKKGPEAAMAVAIERWVLSGRVSGQMKNIVGPKIAAPAWNNSDHYKKMYDGAPKSRSYNRALEMAKKVDVDSIRSKYKNATHFVHPYSMKSSKKNKAFAHDEISKFIEGFKDSFNANKNYFLPPFIYKNLKNAWVVPGTTILLSNIPWQPKRTITKEGVQEMKKLDLERLVKEVISENTGQGYAPYPYDSQVNDEEQPQEDFAEEWKALELEIVQDKTRSTAIELAKILVKDLELFNDVLDLTGKNQSVGQEILNYLKQAREQP